MQTAESKVVCSQRPSACAAYLLPPPSWACQWKQEELGCSQSWGAGAVEASTGSRLAMYLVLVELAARFLHTHQRVSGEALQVAWTSPKHCPLGNLPVRGPEREEGRKVLFSVSRAQPDSTNPVTFFSAPVGFGPRAIWLGVGCELRGCCVHWLQTCTTVWVLLC